MSFNRLSGLFILSCALALVSHGHKKVPFIALFTKKILRELDASLPWLVSAY